MFEQVHRELARQDEHGSYSSPDKGNGNAAAGEFQGDAYEGGVSKVSLKSNAHEDLVSAHSRRIRVIPVSGKNPN